jgi:glycosyltransferase involved in cell wall biosynthesis
MADAPRLLFAGQVVAHKGVHTLLEALSRLSGHSSSPLAVSIVGTGDEAYVKRLEAQAAALNGACTVTFLGRVPAENMARVYMTHDVLVFPSIWEEPFSIALIEAMASGLAVVGTTTGGSAEVLRDGVNSVTFKAGDAEDLARQLRRLIEDPHLCRQLAAAGQRTVRDAFNIQTSVVQIEELLNNAVRLNR